MATPNLKLVSATPETGKRAGTPRPYVTYYFVHGQRRPIRIARSTSPTAAVCAVIRRIGQGEKIAVAEVTNQYGKLVRLVKIHYRKITIT